MTTIYERIASWIDSYRVPLRGLALTRIFYAATALLFGVSNFTWMDSAPPAFFNPPPGLALLWDNFPDYPALQFLSTGICLLYLFLLFGYRTQITSILLSIFLIVGNSFAYSFGKIDHDILMVIFPLVMSFSGWGAVLSLDSTRHSRKNGLSLQKADSPPPVYGPTWPIALMALFIGFGYFSAGLGKLSWVDFDLSTQGARSWLIRGYYVYDRQDLLAPLFVSMHAAPMWEMMDLMAVLFEVGFLFAVLRPRLFRLFVAAAVIFHLINYLMLNISFSGMIRIYGVFLPWTALIGMMGARRWSFLKWRPSLWGLMSISAVYVPLFWLSQRILRDALPAFSLRSVSPLKALAASVSLTEYTALEPVVLFATGFAGLIVSVWALVRRSDQLALDG